MSQGNRPRRKVVIAPPGSSSAGRKEPSSGKVPAQVPQGAEKAARRDRDDPPPRRSYRPPPRPAEKAPPSPSAAAETKRAPARQPQARQPVYIQRRQHKAPQGRAAASTPTAPQHDKGLARSIAVVLVTRNHAAIARQQLQKWRAALPALSVRWHVLDLGSTDHTVASLAAERARITLQPGGRADMMTALDRALPSLDADVALVVDVAAEPIDRIDELVTRVVEGAPLAVPAQRRPGIAAISVPAWKKRRFSGFFDLFDWSVQHGFPAELHTDTPGLGDDEVAAVGLLVDRRKRRWLLELAWQARRSLQR